MTEQKKINSRKVAIIGCAEAGNSTLATAIIKILDKEGIEVIELNVNNIHPPFPTIEAEGMKPIEIRPIDLFEMPIIDKKPKPHQDRNVRRASRKSRW